MRLSRSRWLLLTTLFIASQSFGSQAWCKTPILRPGEELLILDAPSVDCNSGNISADLQLPRNFRSSEDPFPRSSRRFGTKGSIPNLGGLDTLNASGSAQFSKPQLVKIFNRLAGKNILFIDLRQEPHGFINEGAISWYGENNAINSTRPRGEIEKDEQTRLQNLLAQESVRLKSFLFTSTTGKCPTGKPTEVAVQPKIVHREEAQLQQLQLTGTYLRIPTPDYQRPSDAEVDRFLSQVKALDPKTWIHFHCAAGRGRTTTFLALYDMFKNYSKISFSEIIERQKLLGG
ncbi:MAG: hypothetical protein ABIQ95_02180, partial [Bdellovibrionia bacterium]